MTINEFSWIACVYGGFSWWTCHFTVFYTKTTGESDNDLYKTKERTHSDVVVVLCIDYHCSEQPVTVYFFLAWLVSPFIHLFLLGISFFLEVPLSLDAADLFHLARDRRPLYSTMRYYHLFKELFPIFDKGITSIPSNVCFKTWSKIFGALPV